jgi:hypothetical protein
MADPVLTPTQVYAIIAPWPGIPSMKYREWRVTYNHVPEVVQSWSTDWDLSVWISANYSGPPIEVRKED